MCFRLSGLVRTGNGVSQVSDGQQKITIPAEYVYGGPVTVTVEQIGKLIASVQSLPECFTGEEEQLERVFENIQQRVEALGLPADRRETAEYRKESGMGPDEDQDESQAPAP